MDKFSKLMGLGSWFTKWILPPHPPKVRTSKKKDGKFQILKHSFIFLQVSHKSKENIGSEIFLQNYVYGLTKTHLWNIFFSSKIHLHVGES